MILLIRKEAASLGHEVLIAEAEGMTVTRIANIKVADHIHALTVDADIKDTEVTDLNQEKEGVIEKEIEREEDQDHLETGKEEIGIEVDMIGMIGNIKIGSIENIEIITNQILGDQRKKRKI